MNFIKISPDQYINLDNVEGVQIKPGNYPNKYSLLFVSKSNANTWETEAFEGKEAAYKWMEKLCGSGLSKLPEKEIKQQEEKLKKKEEKKTSKKKDDEIPY